MSSFFAPLKSVFRGSRDDGTAHTAGGAREHAPARADGRAAPPTQARAQWHGTAVRAAGVSDKDRLVGAEEQRNLDELHTTLRELRAIATETNAQLRAQEEQLCETDDRIEHADLSLREVSRNLRKLQI